MAAAPARYRVKATMLVAKVPGAAGDEAYLRRGALLPAAVAAEEIERLDGLDLLEKVADPPAESTQS